MDSPSGPRIVVKSTFLHLVEDPTYDKGSRRRSASQPHAPRGLDCGGAVYTTPDYGTADKEQLTSPLATQRTQLPCTLSEESGESELDSPFRGFDRARSCSSCSSSGDDQDGELIQRRTSTESTTCSEVAVPEATTLRLAKVQQDPVSEALAESEAEWTTVMMRNLPNSYTRRDLWKLLDDEGFWGRFNFLYLPADFKSGQGTGFAFVNFVSPADALEFRAHFSRFKRWGVPSNKVCNISWANPDQQGLQANIARYRNSSVMHKSVSAECQPLLLEGGVQVAFPSSTKKLWPPSSHFGSRAWRGPR